MSSQRVTDETDVANDEAIPAVEAIRSRRSGHNFDPEAELDDETLEELIRDAALAPSSYNLQPWEFVAVQDDDRLAEVVELAYGQEHIEEAGTAILVVGHTEPETADRVFEEWVEAGRFDAETGEQVKEQTVAGYQSEQAGRDYGIRNASLAAQNLLLSAHARGLTATPMSGFDFEGMAEFLDLPEDKIPVMLVAVGPSGGEEPARLPRRDVEEILHRETY
ncbi:nitroreductase family protein [Halorussus gelatinilyticus]|uniref:Nitroreductase family protein n=1 Tax=Halorussus gelatinilyticus TaxID=2937524 RepID=A0A8U0IM67_9EURY|nr:nitroreductase family protein [Halorussus gelatinilyticus]UPW01482.1 nitroreductase family protein [Halorussus gelatinilyticus]